MVMVIYSRPICPVLPLARHRSISFPVNFQCLTFTARRRPDANTWQTPGSSLFQVGVLAWRCGPEVVAAAVSSMAPFTPSDYLELYRHSLRTAHGASLSELFSLLRLSCHDATVVSTDSAEQIATEVRKCTDDGERRRCVDALYLVTARCFVLEGASDVIYEAGRIMQLIGAAQMALFAISMCHVSYDDPMPLFLVTRALTLMALDEGRARLDMQRAVYHNPSSERSWTCLITLFHSSLHR